MRRRNKTRRLCAESLELRQLLSINDLATLVPRDEPIEIRGGAVLSIEARAAEIQSLEVDLNGSPRLVTGPDPLRLEVGDSFSIEAIHYDSALTAGIFAVEAYVHKLTSSDGPSSVDGLDGRYSARDTNPTATGTAGVVEGVDGGWTIENGWNRLTVTLVHYQQDLPPQVLSRFSVPLQVGDPDFTFDTEALERVRDQKHAVGETVDLPGRWLNEGTGTFHNYAEVDIYHVSDLHTIVWAGALVGNVSPDQAIEGNFVNTLQDDDFSEFWVPEVEGVYLLKYYLDPEFVADELSESNNTHDIRINVGNTSEAWTAPDLTFRDGETIRVTDGQPVGTESAIIFFEDFEAPSDTFVVNPSGTDSASRGQWELGLPIIPTEWRGIKLQIDTEFGEGALVSGNQQPYEDRFVPTRWHQVEAFVEAEDAWEIRIKNISGRAVEPWVVRILGANYELDPTQLSNQQAFDYHAVEHTNGTFDHYFVGTGPLPDRREELHIVHQAPAFDAAPTSDGVEEGTLASPSVGASDIDDGVTSVVTDVVEIPDADAAFLSLHYNFAYLKNASPDDYLRFTLVADDGTRKVLHEERASATNQAAIWKPLELEISEFVGRDVQLLIEAADAGSPSLIEASVDNVTVFTESSTYWSVATFSQPSHGVVTLRPDLITFDYVPDADHPGTDMFTYRLTDGTKVSERGTITIEL